MVLRAVLAELLGLFLDDVRVASAILIWLFFAGTVLPRLGLPSGVPGLVLFAGLAGILVVSVLGQSEGRRG